MRVYEVMTREAITVRPETPIQAAAELMVTCGVSGLPVVDDHGAVVGILSEGDLIVRQKPREHVPWWRVFFDDGERLGGGRHRRGGRGALDSGVDSVGAQERGGGERRVPRAPDAEEEDATRADLPERRERAPRAEVGIEEHRERRRLGENVRAEALGLFDAGHAGLVNFTFVFQRT